MSKLEDMITMTLAVTNGQTFASTKLPNTRENRVMWEESKEEVGKIKKAGGVVHVLDEFPSLKDLYAEAPLSTVRKSNECHDPKTGEFCSTGSSPLLDQREPNPMHLQEASGRMQGVVEDAAKANGMSSDQYKTAVEGNLRKVLGEAEIHVQIRPEKLPAIIKNGQLMSAFEAAKQGGRSTKYMAARTATEQDMFGFSKSTPSSDHPIYGYLSTPGVGPDSSSRGSYGRATLELDSNVKSHSTFQYGDSMDVGNAVPSPVSDPKWYSGRYTYIGDSDRPDTDPLHLTDVSSNKGSWYLETQIHGTKDNSAVPINSVRRVVFDGQPDSKVAAALDKVGIPHTHYNAESEFYPQKAGGKPPAAEFDRLRNEYTSHTMRLKNLQPKPGELPEIKALRAELEDKTARIKAAFKKYGEKV